MFDDQGITQPKPGYIRVIKRLLWATAAFLAATSLAAEETARLYIREYRVQGARQIEPREVERAVYPFLGPQRTPDDIERARTALEDLYHEKGYQTVSVEIPQQHIRRGVVILKVHEIEVGKLRVRDADYYDIDRIRDQVPSLAEGVVPDFNAVTRDIVALNQLADRRVMPELRAGEEPGTIDIDLRVEDTLPLHGSLELNNRNSPNTKPLRLNAALRYDNLWQMGHTIGASMQIAPEDFNQVQVYSGYYMARLPWVDNLAIMLSATKQDTNISTLGSAAVAGKGTIISLRGIYTLPGGPADFNSISFGMDRRESRQELTLAGVPAVTPIHYFPVEAMYTGVWDVSTGLVELYSGVRMHFRGMGSSPADWDANRSGADGSFFVFKADAAYTHDFEEGLQGYLRVHGQVASGPLISSEQISGGGVDTVRGYLEGESMGDQALFGTLELRSPELPGLFGLDERYRLRTHVFVEGGMLSLRDALIGQQSSFELASIGLGARFGFTRYFSGSLNLALPMIEGKDSRAWHPRTLFMIRGEF